MVRLWEDYAMIADGAGGMKAVDISLPDKPVLFGSYPGENTVSLAMAEDYALIADVSGLKVLRTYLYGQSVHELSLPTPGKAYGLHLEGSDLWVSDRRGGVALYDVSSPSDLSEKSLKRVFPSAFAEDILLRKNLLYVADGPAGIKVYDRESDDNSPLAEVPVSGRARGILSYGQYIVVLSSGDGLLFLKEVEEGELSLQLSSRLFYPDVRDALFRGSSLFVGDRQEGLVILDVDEKGSAFELAVLSEYRGIKQLLLQSDILYVLWDKGVTMLDVQNPESPVLKGEIALQGGERMSLAGGLLYVAEGFRGVSIYSVSENFSALKVSDCEGIFAVDVAPAGAYAFFADMEGVGLINVLIPEWLQK
jgi:hypothetical protein